MYMLNPEMQQFTEELINYIERFIVSGTSFIRGAVYDDSFNTARGHGIQIIVNINNVEAPEMFRPIFYVEDLYDEYKEGHSVAFIAEKLNANLSQLENEIEDMYNGISSRNIDLDDAIITIVPNVFISNENDLNNKICRNHKELGFTEFLKCPIYKNSNGTYFTEIGVNEVRDKKIAITDEIWERARRNTFRYADINVKCMNLGSEVSPLVHACDNNEYANFFYLLDPGFLSSLCDKMNISGFYILPEDAYGTMLLPIKRIINNNAVSYKQNLNAEFIGTYLAGVISDNIQTAVPIYVFDNMAKNPQIRLFDDTDIENLAN
jgi:hypothetical protein